MISLALAASAAAQSGTAPGLFDPNARPPAHRVFIHVNFAMAEGPQQLSLAVPAEVFGGSGSIDVDDAIGGATMLDLSAGVHHRQLVFGAGFSRFRTTQFHEFTASTIPAAPGGFTRSLRYVTPGLDHRERTVYLFAGFARQLTRRVEVIVSGGPAFIGLTQEIPSDITQSPDIYGEFVSMSTRTIDDSAIGLHGALNVNFMLHRHAGVGVLMRFTRATIDLPDSTDTMSLGGLHLGGGARVRF